MSKDFKVKNGLQVTTHITASGHISGSIVEGQTLTADVFLSAPSASLTNLTNTNITSSGHISASGNGFFTDLTVRGNIDLEGDIDVNGTANLDNIDVDGTANFADNITIAENKSIFFDSTDTFIKSNTDNPEDLVISADEDIILAPDDNIQIEHGATQYAEFRGDERAFQITGDISASGNITGSTIQGETLTANVFLSSPSASITNLTNTNITASGNISGSLTSTLEIGGHATIGAITASSYTGSFVGDGSGITGVTAAVDIDSLDALGGTGIAQGDKLIFSDAGTEKSITFSNLEDAIFGNVSGEATIAAGGALTIAANSIGNNELKQDDDITLQSLTTTNNISGSTIEGQTLTADVFLSAPSASITNLTNTNITSSGNISASGTFIGGGLNVKGTTTFNDGNISNVGDIQLDSITDDANGDTIITMGAAEINIDVNGVGNQSMTPTSYTIEIPITASSHITAGGNISASGNITASSYTGSFVGDGSGITGISTDIDGLAAGTSLHQTQDHFMFSDNGTEKKITFSNLEDAIFGNVSGEATIAAGGALTIAANSIGNNELKQDDDITLQSLTTTNNISGSTIEGQTLTADVFLSTPSASITNLTNTNITSSGNISGSLTSTLEIGGHATIGAITASSYTGSFVGDGSGLTGVTTTVDIDGFDAFSGVPHATQDEFLISDNGTEKRATMTMVANGAFALVSGNATIAAGGALSLADNSVGNDEMADNAIGNAELKQDDDITLQSLTTTNNISGSTIEGQILTADVFLSSPSASLTNITTTNITASGNISGSLTSNLTIGGDITTTDLIATQITASIISASTRIHAKEIRDFGNGHLTIRPDADLNLGTAGTDEINIGRTDSATCDLQVFANSSTPTLRIVNKSAIFAHPITASSNISGSLTSTLEIGGHATIGAITASSYTGSFVGDGSGLTSVSATVADESITLAKLAHAAANTVLVRDANSEGDPSFKAVTNTQILIGDGTGFTAAALSGDVTMTNAGVVSVADNKIGNSELKQDDDITLQSLTTTNNISGSTIEGQTLTADVFLSAPSASIVNLTNTNITSSGNITGSTIEGQTLTADVFLSAPSASLTNITNTNITASGNYSGSSTSTFTIGGKLQAGSKSFLIPRPEGGKLEYGVLEGQQNDVFYRGELKGDNTIYLPKEWEWLVDENTITTQLTSIGQHQELYFKEIKENKIFIDINGMFKTKQNIHCYYIIHGTRKDIELIRNYQ